MIEKTYFNGYIIQAKNYLVDKIGYVVDVHGMEVYISDKPYEAMSFKTVEEARKMMKKVYRKCPGKNYGNRYKVIYREMSIYCELKTL